MNPLNVNEILIVSPDLCLRIITPRGSVFVVLFGPFIDFPSYQSSALYAFNFQYVNSSCQNCLL